MTRLFTWCDEFGTCRCFCCDVIVSLHLDTPPSMKDLNVMEDVGIDVF